MTVENPDRLLRTALECARAAGELLRRLTREGFRVSSKSAKHDLVTTADLESEKLIVDGIRAAHPGHDIEAEEGKYPKTGSPVCWHVDPVDGTANFAKGVPFFCVSVAAVLDGEPVAAVVHDPSRGETFWATAGGGAFLDGERIHVSAARRIDEAMLSTGFHYDRGERMAENVDSILRFYRDGAMEIRRLGSTALEMAYVAAGRLDGYWEDQQRSWDIAAGILLVREAGGRATDRDGADLTARTSYTVASNGHLHGTILATIRAGRPA